MASTEHEKQPVVIEQTGKKWKALQLFGGLAVVAGIITVFAVPALGAILLVIGLVLIIYGRTMAWWHHG